VLLATADIVEKFSIPQVSGIQIESIFESDRDFEQCNTSSTDSNEPKLHAIRMN
jgi:hypothetical protein